MGDLKEEIIVKTIGIQKKPEETIGDVKQRTENMRVIDGAMETAKKLAGTGALEEEMKRKDKRMEQLEKEKDEATNKAHAAEIQTVRTELGAKIDRLAESLKAGASPKSLGDQIADIKKAAGELGMGGSKFSEIQEMMNLIEKLNPRKNLADQVREARELLASFQSAEDKGKGVIVEGVPAEVAIKLKEMDHNLQITLAKMEEERQRRDQEFTLTLRKYDDERNATLQEINARIAIEQGRNQLLAGSIERLGKAIGRGYAEGAREETSQGSIGQRQAGSSKTYQLEVPLGESGEFDCPNCHTAVGIGPTSTIAQCVKCGSKFPITRIPGSGGATQPAAKSSEPLPSEHAEEELE